MEPFPDILETPADALRMYATPSMHGPKGQRCADFWYLATPYSKYPQGIEQAYRDACREAAILVKAKIPFYSPIAHTHPIAIQGDIDPFDHNIWLPACRPILDAAKGIIVCQLEGWSESYGVAVEILAFRKAHKSVVFMTPGVVPELPGDAWMEAGV